MTRPIQGRSLVWLAAFAIVATATGPLHAAVSREAALFDRPVKAQTIPAKPGDDPIGQVICTYYPGLMVRESGTDTPDPADATLIAVSGANRPACSRTISPAAIAMKTEGFSLLGRKGPYLVFDATDPNGAVGFMVISATSGAILLTDGKTETGLRSVTLKADVLGLSYRRAVNGSCSVVQEGAACWVTLAKDGSIPPEVAKAPPPIAACKAAYRKATNPTAPADDPSIIEYDQVLTLDASGKAHLLSHGAVGCEPTP